MNKVLLHTFLVLVICNSVLSESLLPECEGNDKNISSFSMGHFNKVRKWTNCQGSAMGPRGEKYVGDFYKGNFHGYGTFSHDGRTYVGQYKNHKKHGTGTYVYANGDKYVGEWKKAKYDGYGTYTYANGDEYIGEWKNGKRHGKGTFTSADGQIKQGIWKKNKIAK